MCSITEAERTTALLVLRERRSFLRNLIEMHKSQRRRGVWESAEEMTRLEIEHTMLDGLIRKLWKNEES
jgi:hypothetical protein